MAEVFLVAIAVGLGNFAAAIGIGIGGVDASTRLRVGLVFGGFEAAMPIIGLLLGRRIAGPLGSTAALFGGALLIATGLFGLVQARRAHGRDTDATSLPMRRLIVIGAALSVDNLVVGVALGASQVSLLAAVAVIAIVCLSMSLLGLELGRRLGARFEQWANELGACVLVLVGIVVATGLF